MNRKYMILAVSMIVAAGGGCSFWYQVKSK
ncbi:nitrogen fixation-related uncharacterized protein [Paenibacillus sp. OAS669]|nr:nitrogen fixation-related uncharacterized protein [Paenibacillus sp. OAS669]